MREINRHAETLAALKSEEYRTQISEINQSLRSEVASDDPYVRRMRPTFGYLMAFTWAAQMLALAWVILEDPHQVPLVLEGFESLGLIWTVGLSVLGMYVYKRSEDKKMRYSPVDETYVTQLPEPKVLQEQGTPPQKPHYNN